MKKSHDAVPYVAFCILLFLVFGRFFEGGYLNPPYLSLHDQNYNSSPSSSQIPAETTKTSFPPKLTPYLTSESTPTPSIAQTLSPSPTPSPIPTPSSKPPELGIYTSSWNFGEFDAKKISSSFDFSQSYYILPSDTQDLYDLKVAQVHALNPNYKFLLYRNCLSVHVGTDEYNYAKAQGWLLKGSDGNYVTESTYNTLYPVDITNSSYQLWLGNLCAQWLAQHPSFDGILADNALKCSSSVFNSMCSAPPINPQTGTYYTDQEILDGCSGILNTIIDKIGTNYILMPNGIWNGATWSSSEGDGYRYILSKVPRLNALQSEGTFGDYTGNWYSENSWHQSVDLISWIQHNFLSEDAGKYFSATCIASVLPSGASTEQVMTYGYCSMMLATEFPSPRNTIDFVLDYSTNLNALSFAQKLRAVDLNEPLGSYYQVNSTSIYCRDFVGGKIIVNPSFNSCTMSLSNNYITFDGELVSGSLTITPHTGVILFNS